jgi:Mg-chelatase subunit ChlD
MARTAASLFGRRWLLAALLPLLLLPLLLWLVTREGETVTCVATQQPRSIVLVLDTSNSMGLPADLDLAEADAIEDGVERGDPEFLQQFQRLIRQPGRKRFDDAREAAILLMKAVPDTADAGLVTFIRTCDARVDVRPARDARARIIDELEAAAPRSGTPLAAAIKLAANELAVGPSDAQKTMVILTDGRESCRGDPCAEAQRLKARLPNAVVHVVDVTGRSGLHCVASVTGGTIVTARRADQLRTAIRKVQTTICR